MKGVFSSSKRGSGGGQQVNGYSSEESIFYDDSLLSNPPNEFWMRLNEQEKPDEDEILFQGRLWQKSNKNKKWVAYHFELYSDKILRVDLTPQKDPIAAASRNISLSNPANNNGACTPGGAGAAVVVSPIVSDTTTTQISTYDPINGGVPPQPPCQQQQQQPSSFAAVIEYTPINCCFLKKIKYSENSYSNYKYGIRLQRGEHKTELFTENSDTFNKWHDEIKRFCILSKFSKKYKILTKLRAYSLLPNATSFFKCYKFSDSTQYSVRVIEKYSLSESNKLAIRKEIAILRKLDSPFLCRLYEIYEDENNLYLISELFQGKDMKTRLSESIILDEKAVSEIMWRLLQGLQHLHFRNIFHRDIKLESIHFRNPANISDVCLTNFLMADFFDAKSSHGNGGIEQSPNLYKKCGTVGFIAPEIFKSKFYDHKVDVFSLGVIFYILLLGRLPFDAQQPDQVLQLNEQCNIDFTSNEASLKCTSSAIELLKKMLAKDPVQRPSTAQLINHTWFINMKNRGEDGRTRNNYYGMPSLSTIQERSSEFVEFASSRQEVFYRRDDNVQTNNSSSKVYDENNLGFETLQQKMHSLNSTIFFKVPSKPRHDLVLSKIS